MHIGPMVAVKDRLNALKNPYAHLQLPDISLEAVEASRWVGPAGVQVLGGHGFMQDYPMEKAMREARALGLLYGGYDASIEISGRMLCDSAGPIEFGAAEVL